MSKDAPSVRIRLSARVRNVIGELDKIKLELPTARPPSWLCRIGRHRWTAWDLRPGDFRTFDSRCKRGCGARRVMVYKHGSTSAAEAFGAWLTGRLRRDIWDRRSQRSRRGSSGESNRH